MLLPEKCYKFHTEIYHNTADIKHSLKYLENAMSLLFFFFILISTHSYRKFSYVSERKEKISSQLQPNQPIKNFMHVFLEKRTENTFHLGNNVSEFKKNANWKMKFQFLFKDFFHLFLECTHACHGQLQCT